jgi:hypothetical protein
MKSLRRTAVFAVPLVLAVSVLTGCTDSDDCDDASGSGTVTVVTAARFTEGKKPGGKSKSKKNKITVHRSDDCEDDD